MLVVISITTSMSKYAHIRYNTSKDVSGLYKQLTLGKFCGTAHCDISKLIHEAVE